MRVLSYLSMMAIAMFAWFTLYAQTDTIKNKPQVKIGVFYNSDLNYYGRVDSLHSSGVFPLAEIWFTKNFYINAAPVFVNNSIQHLEYAGTVATMGYQFDNEKNWAGNFYILKPFYKDNSQLVQSALKGQLSASLTSKNKIINITGGGDIKLSDKVDFGAMTGIDHIFRFQLSENSVMVVDPSATVNAGTQQFTNTYYKKNNFLLFPGPEEEITENVKKFNILSYEFSMPVIYARNKWQILLIPAWVMPKNLITVANRPDLSERGKNLFYFTLGGKVIL